MPVATRVFFLLFLVLSQSSISFGETDVGHSFFANSAEINPPEDSSVPESSKQERTEKSSQDFFKHPSDSSEKSCVIECDACASGGFTLTCDRLA